MSTRRIDLSHTIEDGKAEAEYACGHIDVLRTVLAEAANMADFVEDLEAAEKVLLLYLSM